MWGKFVSKVLGAAAVTAVTLAGQGAAQDGATAGAGQAVPERLALLLGAEQATLAAQTQRRIVALASTSGSGPEISYSERWLDDLPAASGGAEWACLTKALYFEARGESVKGQFAVAEVILNRAMSRDFPNSVCGVVEEGVEAAKGCQFSFMCDGRAEAMNNSDLRARLGKVARLMLDGAPRQLTRGATFYHSRSVNPRWARVFTRTATIGNHVFYRPEKLASRE